MPLLELDTHALGTRTIDLHHAIQVLTWEEETNWHIMFIIRTKNCFYNNIVSLAYKANSC